MNTLILLTLIIFLIVEFVFVIESANIITKPHYLDARIYNGYPAQISNTRHQVSIRLKVINSFIFGLGHICGGSLISPSAVLTAAHCMIASNVPLNETKLALVMGTIWRNIRENNTLVYNIRSYVIHPNFNITSISYDIAYIKMDGEVPANHPTVQPIQLIDCKVQEQTLCQVTGWGVTEEKIPSDELKQVDVRIIEVNTCNVGYEGLLTIKGQLCAGFLAGGKDACSGDSGGPLVCNGNLTGIVSSGDGCGIANKPGIYTDVLFFRDWIANLTWDGKIDLPIAKCDSSRIGRLSVYVLLAIVIFSKFLINSS